MCWERTSVIGRICFLFFRRIQPFLDSVPLIDFFFKRESQRGVGEKGKMPTSQSPLP
jgi:hypothetical protein